MTKQKNRSANPPPPPLPSPFYALLNEILKTLQIYYKYLGPVIILAGVSFFPKPFAEIKDMINIIVAAQPGNAQAACPELGGVIEKALDKVAWMGVGWIIAAVLFAANLVTAISLYFSMRNNQRNHSVICEMRKEIEKNDPGGRTSSGLNEFGNRP